MTDLNTQLHAEINTINRTLAAFNIDAGTKPAWTTIAGASFVAFGLRTGPAQRISDIARLLPELQERLSAQRHRPTPVRLREMPLALEVAHPTPAPLDWRSAVLRIGPARLLIGRNYTAAPPTDAIIDLAHRPHILVAGTTGSGKSTLLRTALCSLAYSTPPETLRLILVDLKNEDLLPFAHLPHTFATAYTADAARTAIRLVAAELRRRIDQAVTGERILLVIDELAQIDPDSLDALASILAVGRSKQINVLAATQHPTVRLIGDKANYAVRLVGQVVDAQTAALATGRKNTGAELLPGAGAFLHIDGAQLDRIQAYHLPAAAAATLVATITDKWGAAPVRTSAQPLILPAGDPPDELAPVRTSAPHHPPAVQFPLPRRAPTAEEAAAIRKLHAELGSQNRTIVAVYGSKSSDTHRWVSEALATTEPAPILRMAGGAH